MNQWWPTGRRRLLRSWTSWRRRSPSWNGAPQSCAAGIGERAEYPTDPAEVSLLLTEAEEQEAILATLKARRDG